MCDNAVNSFPFIFDSIPYWYTTQELCDKIVSEDHFMLRYCHDKYKTQNVCDNAVYSCLLALENVTDWFATSKMIKKLDSVIFFDDYIVFGDLHYGFCYIF